MYHAYTGIGSRQTPDEVLTQFTELAAELETLGFTLRSGGADGADSAFEAGVNAPENKEIFLPWNGFNNRTSEYVGASAPAMEVASQLHPVWERLKRSVKSLHGRNVHQLLGWDMKRPSVFVVAYTPGGALKGGTATALKLAEQENVKIFNFGNPEVTKKHVIEYATQILSND